MSRLLIPNTCQVPNVLLDSIMPRVGASALKVLLAIVRQTYGFGMPSRQIGLKKLSALAGLSTQGVLNGVRELGDLIVVKRGPRNSRTANEYALNIDVTTGQLVNGVDQSKFLTSQKNEARPVNKVDSLKPIRVKPNNTGAKAPESFPHSKRKKHTRPEPAMVAAFDRFYSAYPKHVGREPALQALGKLEPDERLTAVIRTAVENQKRWRAEQATNPKAFIPEWPNPATWLNGKRWTDETPTPNGNGQAKPTVKDLGDGFVEVDGRRMDRQTYARRYEQQPN